eukprot:3726524-Pyramimonas_sp.AAC.1
MRYKPLRNRYEVIVSFNNVICLHSKHLHALKLSSRSAETVVSIATSAPEDDSTYTRNNACVTSNLGGNPCR